jgi:serine/threonine protein phosphatase PrpC
MIPKLFHDDMAFCAVFDGTVGHHASEFLMRNVVDVMLQTEEMQQVMKRSLIFPTEGVMP